MKPRELDKMLKAGGWEVMKGRGKGSHRLYRHSVLPGILTVPWHLNEDLKPGTLNHLLKTAGLK